MKQSERYLSLSFPSLDAFASYLDGATVQPLFKGAENSGIISKSRTSWAGSASLAEASELLKFGDRENAAALVAGVRLPSVRVASVRPRLVRSVAGSSVNVAAALAGRPKSMYKIARPSVPAKVLTLAYDMSAAGVVPAAELRAGSLKVANVILSLEKAGYRVNLYAAVTSLAGSQCCGMFVRVKSAEQYLDIARLAYCLVHPSFLRRHFFRFAETLPGLGSSFVNSYGRNVEDERDFAGLLDAAGLRGCRLLTFQKVRRLDESQIAAAALAV